MSSLALAIGSYDNILPFLKRSLREQTFHFKLSMLCFTLWDLWKWRNEAVFQGKGACPWVIAGMALKFTGVPWNKGEIICWWTGLVCSNHFRLKTQYVISLALLPEWIKLNFHESNIQVGGIGGACFTSKITSAAPSLREVFLFMVYQFLSPYLAWKGL